MKTINATATGRQPRRSTQMAIQTGTMRQTEHAMSPSQIRSTHRGSVTRAILLLLCVGWPSLTFAQGTLSPVAQQVFLDTNGKPLNNGKICTYAAGTTTPLATYFDPDLAVGHVNANPVRTNSAGRPTTGGVYLSPTSYKFVLLTAGTDGTCATGTTIYSQDDVPAVPQTAVGLDVTGTAGEALNAGDAVYLSDGSGALSAGRWYKASATNTYSSSAAGMVGIATAAVATGASGAMRVGGRATGLSGLSAGTSYYVGATAGALAATAPANARFVGTADSTTTIVIAPNPVAVSPAATIQTTTATGTQNNFVLTSARRLVLYVNNATAVSFTGFAAATNDGDTVDVVPIGAGTVALTNQDAGSNAAQRVITTTGFTWTTSQPIRMIYDITTARWRMASAGLQAMVLLKANSGTTTNASAENVDTIAISGLTAKDTLRIFYSLESVAQATAQPLLQNSTDTVTVANLYSASLAAGVGFGTTVTIRQFQSAATAVWAFQDGGQDTAAANKGFITTYSTFTTAWTGSWTLALRHGGVTAGGTLKWSWSVYVIKGQ